MTDELGRLDSALRATSPQPPEPARERAISAAMEAFDRHHQGIPGGARRKGQVPKRGTSWMRRLAMPMSRPTLAIAGVAGFALLAGVVGHLTSVAPPLSREDVLAPASVSPPEAEPVDVGSRDLESSRLAEARTAEERALRRAAEQAGARALEERRREEAAAREASPASERYRLLPGQSPPSAVSPGDERLKAGGLTRTESLVEIRAAPAAASPTWPPARSTTTAAGTPARSGSSSARPASR